MKTSLIVTISLALFLLQSFAEEQEEQDTAAILSDAKQNCNQICNFSDLPPLLGHHLKTIDHIDHLNSKYKISSNDNGKNYALTITNSKNRSIVNYDIITKTESGSLPGLSGTTIELRKQVAPSFFSLRTTHRKQK